MFSFILLTLLFSTSFSYPWENKDDVKQWYVTFANTIGKFARKEVTFEEGFSNWSPEITHRNEDFTNVGLEKLKSFLTALQNLDDLLAHYDVLYFHNNRALVNFVYMAKFGDGKQVLATGMASTIWDNDGKVISWTYYSHKGNMNAIFDYMGQYLRKKAQKEKKDL